MQRNEVVLDGRLLKRSALRYTPAGIPVLEVVIGHSSIQAEAGGQRKTLFRIEATAIGEMALRLSAARLNRPIRVSGFLAQHSVGNTRPVLHAVRVEALGGDGRD